jgi:hypothetical protein
MIRQFVEGELRPRLALDFVPYKSHDLVRMRGPFVQLLAISVRRSGSLRVHPTFFVVGADPVVPVIPQNVSLEVLDPWKWSFPNEELTRDFADRLRRELDATSPLSFAAPLSSIDDSDVSKLFEFFDRKTKHWSASLYLAHYLLATGRAPATAALHRARAKFDKLGSKVSGAPPVWRIALGARIGELERRLTLAEGPGLCRIDSDDQAATFGLPTPTWT